MSTESIIESSPVSSRIDVRRLLAFTGLGSLVGTLGDKFAHEAQGVLWYPHPTAFGEAWWVPLVMAGAGLSFPLGHMNFRQRVGARPAPATGAEVATTFVMFAVAYYASGRFQEHPWALTAVFVAVFVLAAWRARWSAWQWAFALGCAITGSAVEALLSSTGAFFYTSPDLFGVPVWLPALYLHVARFASAIERRWPVA